MRTLNDYFMSIGSNDFGTPDSSDIVVCPDGGRVIGVAFNTTEAINNAATSDVLVNGAAASPAVDVDFAVTAIDTAGVARCDSSLYIADGDSIQLTANANSGTGICDMTLIIRR
jgi:hypothetical protein